MHAQDDLNLRIFFSPVRRHFFACSGPLYFESPGRYREKKSLVKVREKSVVTYGLKYETKVKLFFNPFIFSS